MEGRLENWRRTLTTKRSGHCRGTTVTTTRGGRCEAKSHLSENSEELKKRQIEHSDAENWILRFEVSGAA